MNKKNYLTVCVLLLVLILGRSPESVWPWGSVIVKPLAGGRRPGSSGGRYEIRPIDRKGTSGDPVGSNAAGRPVRGNSLNFRPGELIVKVKEGFPSLAGRLSRNADDTGSRHLDILNRQFGVTRVEAVFDNRGGGRTISQNNPLTKVMLLKLGERADVHSALRAYADLDEIEYAELNYIYHIFSSPDDPFISSQYSLFSASSYGIDALRGWSIESGDRSIMIAIIDTGVDYRHEDLRGKVVRGYDFVNEDHDPMDDNGHGTHVAGIAAGIANNGRGIAGVCPECSVLAVKVVTADGSGANSWIANGIANAVNLGAKVLNMSLGGLDNSHTIRMAVEHAWQQGAILVAASGNDGSSAPMYPAALPQTISVGATGRYRDRTSFSNYGNTLELAAPGESIYGTVPGNRYEPWNGTSMAAPQVSGVVGLILSRNSFLNAAQVRQILDRTASDIGPSGRDMYYGYGRVNVLAALAQVPDSSGNLPNVPDIGDEDDYPVPSPENRYLCGSGGGALFSSTLVALGLVSLSSSWQRRKGKRQKKLYT
ncbi:hypothetical protein CSB45_06745 [candidate division KSB3 bacterium]|uniref:Peptidase S8/S53 domain-containing protein n=1 Tax=candidate division KSB3 bacterium TaxID=2044937 RepID=A0A2G6E6X4_9BACT|nr:MAG: hypothetical protein CSB45_06745 [candidate division KSB3 bacterium]PIE30067.1 MAG: hypothetical protein CSA57_05850 [candidate division KSB3 bacterium]